MQIQMATDEEEANYSYSQMDQFVDEEGQANPTQRPAPTRRARTKDDLLPLRMKMIKDYAKSKAANKNMDYSRFREREKQLAETCIRKRQHQQIECSRVSSIEASEVKLKKIENGSSAGSSEVKLFAGSRKKGANSRSQAPLSTGDHKYYEDIIVQNNDYFHRVNQTVMNRLLNIIESKTGPHTTSVQNSTNHHSLNQSRKIVINNILPQKDKNLQYLKAQERVDRLEKQRKTFSYTTPRHQKEPMPQASMPQRQQTYSQPNHFQSVNQTPASCVQQTTLNKNNEANVSFQQVKIEPELPILGQASQASRLQLEETQKISFVEYQQPTYRTEQNNVAIQDPPTYRTHKGCSADEMDFRKMKKTEEKINESKLVIPSLESEPATEQVMITQEVSRQIKPAVFIQIPFSDNPQPTLSLADAFKQKIGKLSSQSLPKRDNKMSDPSPFKKKSMQKYGRAAKQTQSNPQSSRGNKRPNTPLTQINVQMATSVKGDSKFVTPKSSEPSQDLLNRLIGGSKAKISKKEMYALTKKNYENLPEVQEKKKQEKKRELEQQRLDRIKEYQKSIRSSKSTVGGNI